MSPVILGSRVLILIVFLPLVEHDYPITNGCVKAVWPTSYVGPFLIADLEEGLGAETYSK
jgi:hypothetical protein